MGGNGFIGVFLQKRDGNAVSGRILKNKQIHQRRLPVSRGSGQKYETGGFNSGVELLNQGRTGKSRQPRVIC
ncbi:hypothetical protein PC116_g4781 [Phytophthora cactorum]|uniref:Uncharacterized protein n=1 Tax=Phytophthora cactorum TaxID=29920 RepID=A0A8T1LIS4_9STRA|nr:hypothetical protein PC114_g10644 [Phytophthora cactorum]KAG2945169.1 hypothetical protein PC117_g8676 [Phytophthora cactorum]KAG3171666.1 hypothetical protein C6341_g10449 [Phytophthora cactorum]KAG4247462.1 hypothetical protein PC116_g4781 [Phytophthora cactorum]